MKTRRCKYECVLGTTLVLVALFLCVVRFISFSLPFYAYEYKKNQVSDVVCMNDEDLMDTTHVLFDYIQGKRDSLVIEKEINGTTREVFTGRELLHMVDVRHLYANSMRVMLWCFVGGCLLIGHSIALQKHARRSIMLFGYKYALLILSFFVVVLTTLAIADFDAFWVNFHYLLFDNELFFLDPNQSILVNMVPDQFFFDLVMAILVCFSCIVLLIGWLLDRPSRKRL